VRSCRVQTIGVSTIRRENQYLAISFRLSGRGTVEFIIEKGNGSTFSPVGGKQKNTATI